MALTFCSIEDRRALFFHPSLSLSLFLFLSFFFFFFFFCLFVFPFRRNCHTRFGVRGDQFPPPAGVTDGGPLLLCSGRFRRCWSKSVGVTRPRQRANYPAILFRGFVEKRAYFSTLPFPNPFFANVEKSRWFTRETLLPLSHDNYQSLPILFLLEKDHAISRD